MKPQIIYSKIYEIRGQKVMIDFDLAELYEVETRVLNQSVKRNIERFPERFMFRLTPIEWESMLSKIAPAAVGKSNSSQIVMSSKKHRGALYLPYAFTEHGVAMLASVLRSKKAIQMSVAIIDAFIALKQFALTYKELADKIMEMERKNHKHFKDINEALNYLLQKDTLGEKQSKRKQIGYR